MIYNNAGFTKPVSVIVWHTGNNLFFNRKGKAMRSKMPVGFVGLVVSVVLWSMSAMAHMARPTTTAMMNDNLQAMAASVPQSSKPKVVCVSADSPEGAETAHPVDGQSVTVRTVTAKKGDTFSAYYLRYATDGGSLNQRAFLTLSKEVNPQLADMNTFCAGRRVRVPVYKKEAVEATFADLERVVGRVNELETRVLQLSRLEVKVPELESKLQAMEQEAQTLGERVTFEVAKSEGLEARLAATEALLTQVNLASESTTNQVNTLREDYVGFVKLATHMMERMGDLNKDLTQRMESLETFKIVTTPILVLVILCLGAIAVCWVVTRKKDDRIASESTAPTAV